MEASISCDLSAGKYKVATKIRNLKTTASTYNTNNDRTESRYRIGMSFYAPKVYNPKWNESCFVDSWQCNSSAVRGEYNGVVYVDEVQEDGSILTKEVEGFYSRPSSECSIGTHAVHDSIISAGGYVARNRYFSWGKGTYVTDDVTVGSYYNKSSYQRAGTGPTQKALPTVVAPSVNVVSAISRYSTFYMRIIAETAIKDDFTANPDSYFRYGPNGKIDALAGARYILSLIEEPEDPIIMGDVNGSGTISIADVTLMIDYILRLEVEGFIYEAGDLNQDGNVSIPDVTELIDIINFKDDVSF